MDKKQDKAVRATVEAMRLSKHLFALVDSTRSFNGEDALFEFMLVGNTLGKCIGDYYGKMFELNGPEAADDWLSLVLRHVVSNAENAGINLDVKVARRDNGPGKG